VVEHRYYRLLHWGDCDPGGIIYSPNYARWLIEGVTNLFISVGVDPYQLIEGGMRVGLPVMEQRLRFLTPAVLHDQIEHRVAVAKLGTKSLTFEHRMHARGECLMEATDIRVWGVHPVARPLELAARAIPEHIREVLTRNS